MLEGIKLFIEFQSTPPRGRRRELAKLFLNNLYDFNPRLREGGDVSEAQGCRRIQISIHASAREATTRTAYMWGDTSYFNPRLREGGDLQPHHYKPSHHIFQSTPPRGRRQRRICLRLYRSNFNPRLREGGDSIDY